MYHLSFKSCIILVEGDFCNKIFSVVNSILSMYCLLPGSYLFVMVVNITVHFRSDRIRNSLGFHC